jgi:arginase
MATSRSVSITYVPADYGSVLPGKSKAPKAFQYVGIVKKLHDAGIPSLSKHQALKEPAAHAAIACVPGRIRNEDLNNAVCEQVHGTIKTNLQPSSPASPPPFQLILGGECAMVPAIVSAFWQHAAAQSPAQRVGLIYIDADTDLYTPADAGVVSFFASTTVTHLLRTPGALARMAPHGTRDGVAAPECDASNTALFGTNLSGRCAGNAPAHVAQLLDRGVKVVSAAAVAANPEGVARGALAHLMERGRVDVVLVHLDVDAIDPVLFPLAHVPNFTGVTFEVMMRALGVFLASPKIGALSIAEVNPDHDPGLVMVEKLTDEVVGMLSKREV